MKIFFFLLGMGIIGTSYSQERYLTKTGSIGFEASVPSFEPVAAENDNVTAIIDPATGNIAVLALVKAFRFENALMEEHFNENYAESFHFPKAILKGKIQEFSLEKLSEKPIEKILDAQLTFHGATESMEVPLQLFKKNDSLYVLSQFVLYPEDFNIEIPAIVRDKVAEKIQVKANFHLGKK